MQKKCHFRARYTINFGSLCEWQSFNDQRYSSAQVIVTSFKDIDPVLKITATIMVSRDSQKGILIGAKVAYLSLTFLASSFLIVSTKSLIFK